MAVTSSAQFIPELWSERILGAYKDRIKMKTRSYGERLLRAAAKGEDWTKIQRQEDPRETYTEHAADALAYAIDRDILDSLGNRSGS